MILSLKRAAAILLIMWPVNALNLATAYGAGGDEWAEYDRPASESRPIRYYYMTGKSRMAETVVRAVEDSSDEITAGLGLSRFDTILVYIAPGTDEYNGLTGGATREWSEACSDLPGQRLCINTDAVLKSQRPLKTVIKHELSHLLFHQRVGGVVCPLWFLEGVAMLQSGEWTFSDHWRFLVSLWRADHPKLTELEETFPEDVRGAAMAYGISYIAVNELLADRPRDLITLTAFARDQSDFDRAFFLTFSKTRRDFMLEFEATLYNKYRKRAILLAAGPFWAAAALMFIIIYLVKEHRSKKKLEAWEMEEAAVSSGTDEGG